MSAEYKTRAQKALNRYLRRSARSNEPKAIRTVKKNKKTEYEFVVQPCMIWMKQMGWSVDLYESRAVWDNRAQSYVTKGLRVGHPDIAGCTNQGYAVYCEAKSPGRRSTVKPHQKHFLMNKIKCGAFSCVVDDVEYLKALWAKWISLRVDGFFNEAVQLLVESMPSEKTNSDDEFKIE